MIYIIYTLLDKPNNAIHPLFAYLHGVHQP